MSTDPCKTCEGSGLVWPTAFAELVAWPYALRLAAESYRKGAPWESSPLLTGRIRPVACPSCGGVETVAPPEIVCCERKEKASDGRQDPDPRAGRSEAAGLARAAAADGT